MEFKLLTKLIPVSYIEIDSKEMPFSDLIKVLEALEDTDGYFTFISISNRVIAETLVKYGAAKETGKGTGKGSFYRGEKYKEFRDNFPDYF